VTRATLLPVDVATVCQADRYAHECDLDIYGRGDVMTQNQNNDQPADPPPPPPPVPVPVETWTDPFTYENVRNRQQGDIERR
jgi:hypothetical protein